MLDRDKLKSCLNEMGYELELDSPSAGLSIDEKLYKWEDIDMFDEVNNNSVWINFNKVEYARLKNSDETKVIVSFGANNYIEVYKYRFDQLLEAHNKQNNNDSFLVVVGSSMYPYRDIAGLNSKEHQVFLTTYGDYGVGIETCQLNEKQYMDLVRTLAKHELILS